MSHDDPARVTSQTLRRFRRDAHAVHQCGLERHGPIQEVVHGTGHGTSRKGLRLSERPGTHMKDHLKAVCPADSGGARFVAALVVAGLAVAASCHARLRQSAPQCTLGEETDRIGAALPRRGFLT